MTPKDSPVVPALPVSRPLTTDDLRHKALAVRNVATREVRQLAQDNRTRIIVGVALGCAVVLSIAYLAGSRAGAKQARRRR